MADDKIRVRPYANAADKEAGIQGHLNVSGPIVAWEAFLKNPQSVLDEISKTLKFIKK